MRGFSSFSRSDSITQRRFLIRLNARITGATCSGASSPPSGRRISSAAGSPFVRTALGERNHRLHGGRNVTERSDEIALRLFDPLADRDFFMRLEQFAPADVLQVDANEIDVFASESPARVDVRPPRRFSNSASSSTCWVVKASGSSSSSSRFGSSSYDGAPSTSSCSWTSRPNSCAR
jgi:hypothetical protein